MNDFLYFIDYANKQFFIIKDNKAYLLDDFHLHFDIDTFLRTHQAEDFPLRDGFYQIITENSNQVIYANEQ